MNNLLDKSINFVDNSFGEKKPHFDRTLYLLLKLHPKADLALQIAAYAHDIERAFKPKGAKRFLIYADHNDLIAHQEKSAKIMHDFLLKSGADSVLAERVSHLIKQHEDGGNEDQNLLKDADSISYLETNASKHVKEMILGEFSPKEVRQKFDYMYNRIATSKAKDFAEPLYNSVLDELVSASIKMVHGIIFDFNGVLLWDTPLHDQAWREFAKEIKGYEISNEDMDKHIRGRTNKAIIEYILQREISDAELAIYTKKKEQLYRDFCLKTPADFHLSPGASELLDHLKKTGIPFTIATSSEIGNIKFFFKHLPLQNWFSIDQIEYDKGQYPGKPQPDIYINASKRLNLDPSKCLVVEDSNSGILSASRADIGVIVAMATRENRDDLQALPGVITTISDFYELIKLLTSK